MPGHTRRVVMTAALIGAAVTAAALVFPSDAFAYRSATIHVAVEVAAGLIGLLVCALAWGRFRQSRHGRDIALTYAIGMFAMSNLVFSALPVITDGYEGSWLTWGRMMGTMLGSGGLAVGAFWPQNTVASLRRGLGALVVAWLASVAVILLLGAGTVQTSPHAPAAVLLIQGIVAVLLAGAAVGYLRLAHRTDDGLLAWIAAAATLGAFARVNYLLFPELFPAWLYTGDALRLGFYLLLLAGAARELTAYWRDREQAAVLEERRRLARDFHDGLAQELAYISTQSRRLGGDGPLAAAAQRALDETRRAIAALTRPIDEPLDVALTREAEDLASRTGAAVQLQLDSGVLVDRSIREASLRIMREALTNAVRHGHAQHVSVELRNSGGMLLRVTDDGVGFDPTTVREEGFGLVSMRERAEAVGAAFTVSSAPGDGTRVEVQWTKTSSPSS